MNPIILRQKRTDQLFWGMLAVSLVLHVLFIGVWIVGSKFAISPPAKPPDNIIKTKLVKLGKQRDPDMLPRKVAPPAPPKSKQAPELTQKTEEAKLSKEDDAPKPKSASDILKAFEDTAAKKPDLSQLIQNAVGEVSDEGDERGSELGTDLTGRMKESYNDKVFALIKAKFSVPTTLSDEERIRLKALLFIKISPTGEVSASISQTSGNAALDNAVVGAAKKASPLPPPPIPLREFYGSGVAMNMCPIRCSS